MEITKATPIRFDVIPKSESIVICKFMTRASKKKIKINIDTTIYYQNPTYSNMTDVVTSTTQSVYTSTEDKFHIIRMDIPKFKDRKQSHIIICIDNKEDPYTNISIEDITIEYENMANKCADNIEIDVVPVQSQPMISPQAAMAIPHLLPKSYSSYHTSIFSRPPPEKPRPQLPPMEKTDKITFVSTWGIKCGIATYTKYLTDELNEISPNSFIVYPMNNASIDHNVNGILVHLQHEFGIMPTPPITSDKVIITWHSVPRNIGEVIAQFESKLNIVAYIVHCEGARDYINSTKDVYVINHGSTLVQKIKKDYARKILQIDNIDKPIGFIFGFQSANKKYDELVNAANNTNIHIIASGSVHESGYRVSLPDNNNDNITILNRYLTEKDVDLYISASDILLFDYVGQDHYSCSGAMHRIVGAGRPVICSDTKHFSDIDIALKFKDQNSLEKAIIKALKNQESLGKLSLEYAKKTSWENVAKRHIEIYRKYVDI